MKELQPVLILGAGISGLSAAWRLSEYGIPVSVLEAAPEVGGLAATVHTGPYALDFGPHSFFSEDEEIRRTVLNLFEAGLPEIRRSVKLHYRGKYLNYPFTAMDLFLRMGPTEAARVFLSFLASRYQKKTRDPGTEESVEEWAVKNFGKRLYSQFFKPYTEQFWTIPCSELSARAIPSHTRTGFMQALVGLLTRVKKNGSLLDREKLPTYYPVSGYGEIAEKLAAKVRDLGGLILNGARVTEAARQEAGWSVVFLHGNEEKSIHSPRVISTIPVTHLVSILRPEVPGPVMSAARNLEFRPILVLGIVTTKQNILNGAYQYTLHRPYNRLTEMNRFSTATSPQGENLLMLEIPCAKGDSLWTSTREELYEMCLPALEKDGVLYREDVRGLLLVKAPNAYPVYRKDYKKNLDQVLDFIHHLPGLQTLGRSGEFMYMDADRCMRRAFDFADTMARSESFETADHF